MGGGGGPVAPVECTRDLDAVTEDNDSPSLVGGDLMMGLRREGDGADHVGSHDIPRERGGGPAQQLAAYRQSSRALRKRVRTGRGQIDRRCDCLGDLLVRAEGIQRETPVGGANLVGDRGKGPELLLTQSA